jgi:hypothetical protein
VFYAPPILSTARCVAAAFLFVLFASPLWSQFNSTNVGGYENVLGAGAANAANLAGALNTNNSVNGAIAGAANSSLSDLWIGFIGGSYLGNIGTGSHVSAILGGHANTISANSARAAILGGFANTASAEMATVVGGALNTNRAINGTIAGSSDSSMADLWVGFIGGAYLGNIGSGSHVSAILGGHANTISANSWRAVVLGGFSNTVSSVSAMVGGGENNMVSPNAFASFIGGGTYNTTMAQGASVIGGFGNEASGTNSFAAGFQAVAGHAGTFVWSDMSTANEFTSTANNQFLIRAAGGVGINTNNTTGNALTVSGDVLIDGRLISGSGNTAGGTFAVVAGGLSNTIAATGTNAVIGGGLSNTATTNWTTISGGRFNTSEGHTATVAGGENNLATGDYSTIAGGANNISGDAYSGVAAGQANHALGYYSFVGGGWQNHATTNWATIGGGSGNSAAGDLSAIGGGYRNTNSSSYGFIGGGQSNVASGFAGTIGGGDNNRSADSWTVVAGGYGNSASAQGATVAGGENNTASGLSAAVGGGFFNQATNTSSTVPGGENNLAGGAGSFAAGRSAKATNDGAFVWSGYYDASEEPDPLVTASTNAFSFTVRAPGGVRFISTLADSTNIPSGTYGTGGFTNGVYLAPNSGAWASLSDSNAKTKITPIKPRDILSKVAAMPVTEWEYKVDPDRRYIGPMAQDFHSTFGLGSDDKTISTLDSDGVMYAAIQGLLEEIKLRDEKIAKLQAWSREQGAWSQTEIEELKAKSAEVDELKAKLQAFEERLDSLPPAP